MKAFEEALRSVWVREGLLLSEAAGNMPGVFSSDWPGEGQPYFDLLAEKFAEAEDRWSPKMPSDE